MHLLGAIQVVCARIQDYSREGCVTCACLTWSYTNHTPVRIPKYSFKCNATSNVCGLTRAVLPTLMMSAEITHSHTLYKFFTRSHTLFKSFTRSHTLSKSFTRSHTLSKSFTRSHTLSKSFTRIHTLSKAWVKVRRYVCAKRTTSAGVLV
jgi:hypothetical protein